MIRFGLLRLKRSCLSSIFVISAFSMVSFPASSQWSRINIGGGGAFNSVSVGQSGTIIANSDLGGSYISRDSGGSWEPIGALNSQMNMTHVQSAAFSPDSDNIILLSGESDISRSTDNGKTFNPVTFTGNTTPSGSAVAKSIVFAPSNGSRVYASIRSNYNHEDSQIYRSDDAGQTFYQVNTLSILSNPAILKLIVHPNDPDIVVALSLNGRFTYQEALPYAPQATEALLLSTDGGNSWSNIATQYFNQSSIKVVDVVFHPHTTATVENPLFISVNDSGSSNVYFTPDITTSTPSWEQIHSMNNEEIALWPVNNSEFGLRMIDLVVSWHDGFSSTAWYVEHTGSNWITPVSIAEARDWTGEDANSWNSGWSRAHANFNPSIGGETARTVGFDNTYTNQALFWTSAQFVYKGYLTPDAPPKLEFAPAFTTENTVNNDLWHSRGVDNITATLIDVNDTNPNVIYAGMQDVGCIVSTDQGKY